MRKSLKCHAKVLRSVLTAAALMTSASASHAQTAPSAVPAPQAAPSPPKEITLTDMQMQGVLDAQKDYDAIAKAMPNTEAAQSDPKYITQFEDAATKHGFASYAEYNNAVETVSLVLSGFDSKTKAYVGPEAVIKQQIAAVEADPQMPADDKKAGLGELNAMLKWPPPPAQNKGNIALVARYYDKLVAALSADN